VSDQQQSRFHFACRWGAVNARLAESTLVQAAITEIYWALAPIFNVDRGGRKVSPAASITCGPRAESFAARLPMVVVLRSR